MSNEALALAEQHGGTWMSHPTWGVNEWRIDVSEDNTRQSYWDWVLTQIEQDAD